MKLKICFTIVYIIAPYFSFSQTKDSLKTERNWTVKFAPFNIPDPINPAIQIGLEKRVTTKKGIQLELGHLLPSGYKHYSKNNGLIFPDYKGFKIRLEVRHYLTENSKREFYVASELFYTKNNYFDTGFRLGFWYGERLFIKKNVAGLNFKIGYQKLFGRLLIDMYAGLGIRYKDVFYPDMVNVNEKWSPEIEPTVGNITSDPTTHWTISLPMNIKIGYRF